MIAGMIDPMHRYLLAFIKCFHSCEEVKACHQLSWVVDHSSRTNIRAIPPIAAASIGSISQMKWLVESLKFPLTNSILRIAVDYGHLSLLIWMSENGFSKMAHENNTAAIRGHLEILKWFHVKGYIQGERQDLCVAAASRGHLESLKFLREIECKWDKYVVRGGVMSGSLETVKYCIENGCPCDECCYVAAYYGYMPILQYLHSIGQSLDGNVFVNAVISGSLEIVEWLHANNCPYAGFESGIFIAARSRGYTKILGFLEKSGIISSDVMREYERRFIV